MQVSGYKPDPVNFNFHADGQGVAFSRLWNVQTDDVSQPSSTVLLTHQWIGVGGTSAHPNFYLAPIKEAWAGVVAMLSLKFIAENEMTTLRRNDDRASDTSQRAVRRRCPGPSRHAAGCLHFVHIVSSYTICRPASAPTERSVLSIGGACRSWRRCCPLKAPCGARSSKLGSSALDMSCRVPQ